MPKQINQLISKLETIHKEQIAKEINIYLEVPQSRYIYGNQFNTIYKFVKIQNENEEKKKNDENNKEEKQIKKDNEEKKENEKENDEKKND